MCKMLHPLPPDVLHALLGVCVAVAVAWFVWNRVNALAWLVKEHNFVLALLLGAMAATGVYKGFAKYTNDPPKMVGSVGSRVPRDRNAGNIALPIADADITNSWRVAETREGCEIVARDAFGTPQTYEPWLVRGGFEDVMRIPSVGWSFPWREGFLEGMTVFSKCEFRPTLRTCYFPSPFEAPLAMVPAFNWHLLPGGVSNVFWHATSPSNSLIVTWENSPVNRDVSCTTNFQAEFFSDGRFAYRYQNQTVEYAPAFPFDWDNDGLENTVDPEPLVAGPDAHGTNEEWYNVVCADIVNTNAYYFVDVVVDRGPVPICFNADRESHLGSPIVIARGGETNHVPLLMGVEYIVTSTEPFSVSAPSNAVVTINGLNDGRSFTVEWPLSFDLSPDDGGYAVGVQPSDPGGAFSWTPGFGDSVGPRLLSGGSSCSYVASGNWVGFTGCDNCECGGTSIDGTYTLEGAVFAVPSLWCGCAAAGSGFPGMPQLPASVSVNFDKPVVFYEDAYTNAPNDVVARRSTSTTLSVSVYGGETGGMLYIYQQNMDRLQRFGGENIILPYSAMLPPRGSVSFSTEYEATSRSAAANDISVTALFQPIGGDNMTSNSAAATTVHIIMTAVAQQPSFRNRHIYGVYEEMWVSWFPADVDVRWEHSGYGRWSKPNRPSMTYQFAAEEDVPVLTANYGEVSYDVNLICSEPTGICARVDGIIAKRPLKGRAGVIGMSCLLTLLPTNVCFSKLMVDEIPTMSGTHTGFFASNVPTNWWYHSTTNGAGAWNEVDDDNSFAIDDVFLGECHPPWSLGVMTWDIPSEWILAGSVVPVGTGNTFCGHIQRFELDDHVTASVSKFGHTVTRSTNDFITINGVVVP